MPLKSALVQAKAGVSNMIELKLSVEQVNQILAILGDLPIKSGLTGLAIEITNQAQEQLKDES